jgi:polyhydroxybutyrate depolymerase
MMRPANWIGLAVCVCCTLASADAQPVNPLKDKNLGGAGDSSALKKMTWKVGDVTREALVYFPKSAGAKSSLVFAFHGHGGTSAYAAKQFAFHDIWPEAVCVYPQGLPTPVPKIDPEGKKSGWQKFIGDQDDRDLLFFDAMLKSMLAKQVDEKRVYSTGHSNGGFFTYVLWAARNDALAAVAPVAATMSADFKKQQPKPVLHVAGEKDPIVKFEAQAVTMLWDRELNGCGPVGKPAGKYSIEYSSRNGPPVVTYIHPGGHEIPDGAPRRIVQFLKEHAKK